MSRLLPSSFVIFVVTAQLTGSAGLTVCVTVQGKGGQIHCGLRSYSGEQCTRVRHDQGGL